MPTDRVQITRVQPSQTVKPGVSRYVIWADSHQEPARMRHYETVDPFLASLCQRAIETGKWAEVTWRDTRYGQTATHVELGAKVQEVA